MAPYSSTLAWNIPRTEEPGRLQFMGSLRVEHDWVTSFFFIVQLSHPHMMTGKATALTRWTFVGKVVSLLFNMLSRLVITFLPRSKCLFNFMAAITICSDFGAPQNKVWHCFHCFPIYFPWSDRTGCHDLQPISLESCKLKQQWNYKTVRIARIQSTDNTKYQRGCRATGTLIHCWYECKLVRRRQLGSFSQSRI